MSEQTFDRRAQAWLEHGPQTAPSEAVASILAALETAPQRGAAPLPLRLVEGLLRRDPLDVGMGAVPHRRRRTVALLAAAALLALAAVAGAILLSGQPPDDPAVVAPDLLADFPFAEPVLERSLGPEDRPISDDATVATTPIDRLAMRGMFVVAGSCLGPGQATVVVRGAGETDVLESIEVPCDGTAVRREHLSAIGGTPAGQEVAITVAAGASWQVAVAEYPADLAEAPVFPALPTTEGWSPVIDMQPGFPASVTQGTGVAVQTPEGATRLGVTVECLRDATITVEIRGRQVDGNPLGALVAGGDAASQVTCPTTEARRLEFAVGGGLELTVRATSDTPAWVRLHVETDASTARTYPSAPPMPPDVAATGYSSTVGGFVYFGTLGSNQQQGLEYQGGSASNPTGDLVPITVRDQLAGTSRFDLVSIADARVVAVVADERTPRTIWNGWVDALNGHAIWVTGDESSNTFEWYRTDLDGGARELMATVPGAFRQLGMEQAPDASAFVAQWCDAAGCHRLVLDGPTGEHTVVELADDDGCELLGVIGGLVVEIVRDSCLEESTSPVSVAVSPVGGGERRIVHEGPGYGPLVATATGPVLVHGDPFTEMPTWEATDLVTGASRPMPDIPHDAGFPQSLALPPGWVLFTNILGESPAFGTQNVEPPLLVNLDTGERIVLVNLPHRTE